MKLSCWAMGLILLTGLAWAGAAAPPKQPASVAAAVAAGMHDFDRNTTLGGELTGRPGTKQELAQLQALADRGLNTARKLVAADPKSAGAQYLLGSWLIYGYGVVPSEETYTNEDGETEVQQVQQVVVGLSEDPQEGLDALQKAAALAPDRGDYTLDYAAALLDTDHPDEAIAVSKTAWAGQPELTPAEKMRAGLMVSDALAGQGLLSQAREWVYSALLVNPDNVEAVRRLRLLDAGLVPAEAPPAAEAFPEAPAPEEEVAPEGPEAAPEEVAPEAPAEPGEEAAPPAAEEPSEEYAPESDEEAPEEAAPEN